ncbi:MAG: CoB--CoM heterodisulfide reductase iron-sulfur subunit A family protein [Syntrophobacteraceae bacterium]|nr:CoB--CoM heterodisulfide reductase iron-sulfur subunit A family protein [Syntrophobacteraceae bacterium]
MEDRSNKRPMTGAVMVVGGGIAGAQAALDLADSGFYVYLVEKSPAIGGVMAQLDKTFPTNDCSMCILSPKLVEAGRHLNIELMTLSEVVELTGEAGHFTATVRERARYIDMEKCIACGICAEKCPRKVEDEFNEALSQRKSAFVKYPQAVPLKYSIDKDTCIYFARRGKCKACEKFCPAGAVDFTQQDRLHHIDVGAVILAPGFRSFRPELYDYGYGTHANVVTSTEFERILSASGPFEGHLVRPSDRQPPRKIAWLQCVGSRDAGRGAHGYCSGVCCMYAIKEAVIAREHSQVELDTAIFFMDMRTYGKDFERYYDRAREESGVHFIRSRVHSIEAAAPGSDDLAVTYVQEDGKPCTEVFDMVVLSVGLEIPQETRELAARLGVALNNDGFVETGSFSPVAASRPGVFACGVVTGPKDIPYSVMEASAASAASAASLSSARDTLTQKKTYPPEDPVIFEQPRIGVFVCHCGINIGGVVDVPSVREYAKTLPNVVYVTDNLFTCSQDTQELIRQAIKEHRLNRIVVASCTPRTHEPLFQETIREAGLNRYLFDLANIRDQDSWVHQAEPEKATEKAKDLVRMAVARVALLEPIEELEAETCRSALVIGGGIAGMNAALGIADQGLQVYLVEEKSVLGGHGHHIRSTWKGEDVRGYLNDLNQRVITHPNIEVLTETRVEAAHGFVGQYTTRVVTNGVAREIRHGVVILATGAETVEPQEYLYGQNDRVTRWHELQDLFERDPEKLEQAKAVAFLLCVGSREPERPYCSKVCCTSSIHGAIELKTRKPDLDVYVLYRDIRTYGLREELYTQARGLGVIFLRYSQDQKPRVEAAGENGHGKLLISLKDHVLDRPVRLEVDYLNLATAIVPGKFKDLAQVYKVPVNQDGFFLEAHMKLRPVEFATEGIFVCGLAHCPKPLEESIAQAQAAASKAVKILVQPRLRIEPTVSKIDPELCVGCGLCEKSCPFGAIRLHEVEGRGYVAESIPATCKGCGICAAACPQKAIDMLHFRHSQIVATIRAGGRKA